MMRDDGISRPTRNNNVDNVEANCTHKNELKDGNGEKKATGLKKGLTPYPCSRA